MRTCGFPSQNVQSTTRTDHFWKLRCQTSARRCGAKHISKSKCAKLHCTDHLWKLRCQESARPCGAKHFSTSKCTKHHMYGPLLEVAMWKKCPPLWPEAHFQVKMHKATHVRTTFGSCNVEKVHARKANFQVKMYKAPHVRTAFGSCDVEKVHAVVARSTFPSQMCKAPHVRTTFESCESTKCTSLWPEAHFQVKMYKTPLYGPLMEVAMSKKCVPLWREAHFQVKMHKAPHIRTAFGSCDVEKVHAVVARSTFPSQNEQSTTCTDHFWELRCQESAHRCGPKHISKSKCTKHHMYGPLLEVAMSKKCTLLWQVKMHKAPHVRTTFDGVVLRGRREGLWTLPKGSKTWGFCSSYKTNGRRGAFWEDQQRCISCGKRNTITYSSETSRGQGADFLRGVSFWSIKSSGLLRWFCVTGADFVWPGITSSWQVKYFRQMDWKNHKTHWHKAFSSAHSFTFLKDVSQNCFVVDVVTLKNWGSLAKSLCF